MGKPDIIVNTNDYSKEWWWHNTAPSVLSSLTRDKIRDDSNIEDIRASFLNMIPDDTKGDPFWKHCKKLLMSMLFYYCIEEENVRLNNGFIVENEAVKPLNPVLLKSIQQMLQEATIPHEKTNMLELRIEDFIRRNPDSKVKEYYRSLQLMSESAIKAVIIDMQENLSKAIYAFG